MKMQKDATAYFSRFFPAMLTSTSITRMSTSKIFASHTTSKYTGEPAPYHLNSSFFDSCLH